MHAFRQIERYAALALGLALVVGCSQWPHRRQGEMASDPGEVLPEWAFDAPYYFRPPPDAVPKAASEPNADYPTHYFVSDKVFLLDRPANEVPIDRAPRIAVWWTDTDGCIWNRAGFFGLAQTHFSFVAGEDADYGIRFVGPGIRESLTEETIPHRIYHLDRMPPSVSVWVTPDLPVFDPGQTVNISWVVDDRFLDARSARLNICWSWENPDMPEWRPAEPLPIEAGDPDSLATRLWHPYKKDLDAEGVLFYEIPKHLTGESFQLQVRAQDRAGNYGEGYSRPIFVGGYTDMLKGTEWTENSDNHGLFESHPANPFPDEDAESEVVINPTPVTPVAKQSPVMQKKPVKQTNSVTVKDVSPKANKASKTSSKNKKSSANEDNKGSGAMRNDAPCPNCPTHSKEHQQSLPNAQMFSGIAPEPAPRRGKPAAAPTTQPTALAATQPAVATTQPVMQLPQLRPIVR